MNPILVAGTDAWNDDATVAWYDPTSNFAEFLTTAGVGPLFAPGPTPFVWSTRLGGVFGRGKLLEWDAAGVALKNFVIPPFHPELREPVEQTAVIAHSHGLQVVLFACAKGLKIDTLISVGSPVREDMMPTARLARANIRWWLHIHSDVSDRMQWLGELFDGHFGIVRAHPLADVNESVPHVGHSDLLNNPSDFHYWIDRGWIQKLQGHPCPVR